MLGRLASNAANMLAGEQPLEARAILLKLGIAHLDLSLAFSGTDDYACR
jgi:hypothetical protein